MQPDQFIDDLAAGRAGTETIDGVIVVGVRWLDGRRSREIPPLSVGTFYALAADEHGYEWRVMEQVTADRATPWCVTIGNAEPVDCLRRAIRLAAALNGGDHAA